MTLQQKWYRKHSSFVHNVCDIGLEKRCDKLTFSISEFQRTIIGFSAGGRQDQITS